MILIPTKSDEREGVYRLGRETVINAPSCLDKEIIRELFSLACGKTSELTVEKSSDGCSFHIGKKSGCELSEYDYSLFISPDSVSAYAKNEKCLIRAFMLLIDRIRLYEDAHGEEYYGIPCGEFADKPEISERMVHLCVFPESDIVYLRKVIRLCGYLQVTHVILEFWGMIKYDCMKELSWECAFTKDEFKPIIAEANDMGVEIIPMFNHLGHAAGSRSAQGKHVVLDQNPSLGGYFSDDGWVWRIDKPKVRRLMKQIRDELIELCGEGKFFHIGCDEAYELSTGNDNARMIVDYINEIADDLAECGRRPIMWGDMLICHSDIENPKNSYCCNCRSEEMREILTGTLSKNVIISDWQYDTRTAPIESSLFFRDRGFDVLCCPWHTCGNGNLESCIGTAEQYGLNGVITTTWHTLFHDIGALIYACARMHGIKNGIADRMNTAARLSRRIWFADGRYDETGWEKNQVVPRFR